MRECRAQRVGRKIKTKQTAAIIKTTCKQISDSDTALLDDFIHALILLFKLVTHTRTHIPLCNDLYFSELFSCISQSLTSQLLSHPKYTDRHNHNTAQDRLFYHKTDNMSLRAHYRMTRLGNPLLDIFVSPLQTIFVLQSYCYNWEKKGKVRGRTVIVFCISLISKFY